MKTIVFDVETTGLIDFKADLIAPHQPRICQLAAELAEDDGTIVSSLNAIIKPDGWDSMPEGAFSAHHITFERCMDEGRPMPEVLEEFNAMKAQAAARAAYNIPYDKKMMAREAGYHGVPHDSTGLESYCVMRMATPIVNMAPTGKMVKAGFGYKPKPPKLIEAYQYFFGRGFDGAHDAMADVQATRKIFFMIRDLHAEHFKPEPVKTYTPELALRPAPNGRGEDAALCGSLEKSEGAF